MRCISIVHTRPKTLLDHKRGCTIRKQLQKSGGIQKSNKCRGKKICLSTYALGTYLGRVWLGYFGFWGGVV